MGSLPLLTVDETAARIERRRALIVAGEEALLRRLPRGFWIGGTIPYFMTGSGGLRTSERLCVLELPAPARLESIAVYQETGLERVYRDSPANGFTFILLPGGSRTLRAFALGAPRYPSFACQPLIGWVSGVALEEVGRTRPLVFDGRSAAGHEDAAVVLRARLPPDKTADVGIINLFEPGGGEVLTFAEDGFAPRDVLVAGRRLLLLDYVRERGLDTRLPLVADYNGAEVNVSFQKVDEESGRVTFFAPVFRGVQYRQARPIGDYVGAFHSRLGELGSPDAFYSCNCVLNFMYAGLEGRTTPGMTGPAAFGEIAYQLLNQTLVYVEIKSANLAERLRGETELRRHARELEKMTAELQSANRDLREFASMVSHDLRAPLRHINAFSSLLERSPAVREDAAARVHCERIRRGADRMGALIDDLLDYSRSSSVALKRQPVALERLVRELAGELGQEGPGSRVGWDIAPLPEVLGDAGLLRQAFYNLLSNALKYSADRPDPRVSVGWLREPGLDVVFVRDNGIGFDMSEAGELFKPFHRLRGATGFSGTGIGLAIVARVVERHGGRVWAESKPGEGACFYLSLPTSE